MITQGENKVFGYFFYFLLSIWNLSMFKTTFGLDAAKWYSDLSPYLFLNISFGKRRKSILREMGCNRAFAKVNSLKLYISTLLGASSAIIENGHKRDIKSLVRKSVDKKSQISLLFFTLFFYFFFYNNLIPLSNIC